MTKSDIQNGMLVSKNLCDVVETGLDPLFVDSLCQDVTMILFSFEAQGRHDQGPPQDIEEFRRYH